MSDWSSDVDTSDPEVDVAGREIGDEIGERYGPGHAGDVRRVAHQREDDDALDARHPLRHGRDASQRIMRLAVVEIAVGGEQDPGLDLAEAVEHALPPEIRRAGGPARANGVDRPGRERKS